MNSRPLNVAYEGMTNRELAAAAYAHIDNELEAMRIKATVPRKTYAMLDAQFVDTLERIYTLGQVWTSDFWRLHFLYATDFGRMVCADAKGDRKKSNEYLESIAVTRQTIAAHFEALQEVCEAQGINYKTVLERNGIAVDRERGVEVNLKYKADYIKALEDLLAIDR